VWQPSGISGRTSTWRRWWRVTQRVIGASFLAFAAYVTVDRVGHLVGTRSTGVQRTGPKRDPDAELAMTLKLR
jgi:hypothetical protein